MPSYQSRPDRQMPGSDDSAQIPIRRSSLKPECGHPAVTPIEDFPDPPVWLKPKVCANGFVGVPFFFGDLDSMAASFRDDPEFTGNMFKVYLHVASCRMCIGKPICISSNEEIAKTTGVNIGNVQKCLNRFVELEMFTVVHQPFRESKRTRFIWDNTALRDDLPELSGIDRSDPRCVEPHRPALMLFATDDTRDPDILNRVPGAPARKMRAGAPGLESTVIASPGAPARKMRAGAPGHSHNPASGIEKFIAQPGPSQDLAPIQVETSLACARVGVPAPALAPTNVNVIPSSPEEKTLTFAGEPPASDPIDPERRRQAEWFVRELRGRGCYLWPEGELINVYPTSKYAIVTSEEAIRIKDLKPEILTHLRELKVGPPKNVPGLAPTTAPATDRPNDRPSSPPAPSGSGEGRSTPTERMVRELFRSRDLDKLESATQMMIAYTRDARAQNPDHPNHLASLRFQRKAMRRLIMGETPIGDMLEAMKRSTSETANSATAVYVEYLTTKGSEKKNKLAGASQKLPGQLEQDHASMP